MTIRAAVAGGFWSATLLVVMFAGMRHFVASRQPAPFPREGDLLNLNDVEAAFAVDLPRGVNTWLLVVTSSCPACLRLDVELALLRDASACEGATLVPLIVEFGATTDSIKAVLAKHGLPHSGTSEPAGLDVVRVRSVPTVLELDTAGTVTSVANPTIAGSWPREPAC